MSKMLCVLLALLCASCTTISDFNPDGIEEARPLTHIP